MSSVQFSLFDNQGKKQSATSEIAWLDVTVLSPHPDNPRLVYRNDIIEAIATSISENGFQPEHALLVRPHGEGYQIISGHTRHKAAVKTGIALLPCWVKEMDDESAFMELVLANNQGELSPLEYGMHVLKYVELSEGGRGKKGGLSEYARVVGKDRTLFSKYQSAASVFHEINLCNISRVLDKANHLFHIHKTPQQYWQQLTELLIKNEWSVKQTEEICKAIKNIDIPKHFQDWLPPERYIKKTIAEALSGGDIRTPRDIENWVGAAQEIYDRLPSDLQVEVVTKEDRLALEDWDLRGMFLDELPKLNKGDRKPSVIAIQEIEIKILDVVEGIKAQVKAWKDAKSSDKEKERLAAKRRAEIVAKKKKYQPNGINKSLQDLSADEIGRHFDAIITDVPYLLSNDGFTLRSGKEATVNKNFADNQNSTLSPYDYSLLFYDLLKDGGVFVTTCTIHTLPSLIDAFISAGFEFRQKLVWYKRNSPPLLSADRFKPDYEDIVVFAKPGATPYFGYSDIKEDDKQKGATIDIPQCGGSERLGWHDTQKPVELYELLVKAYCPLDGKVLDPFAGSGTTAIACKKNQRICTWVEEKPDFFERAFDRIESTPFFWEGK